MTQFKSAAELKQKAVRKPISAREEMWAREEALIRDLASNEGAYGQYPKEFTTYNAASAFANTVNKRLRHKFTRKECPVTCDVFGCVVRSRRMNPFLVDFLFLPVRCRVQFVSPVSYWRLYDSP